LPIAGAADEFLSAAGPSVTGRSALSAIEYAPYGVEHGREIAIAIISGKDGHGADREHRNGLTLYFHHSAEQIFGSPKIN
jgi:hypothetical protein